MNVLVIPEDFRKDQYILDPIVTALLAMAGNRTAKVRICQDPLLAGVDQALRWERIAQIIDRYRGSVDLFLLCVDRDGVTGRRASLDDIERRARAVLPAGKRLFGETAWEELEVWLLAGHDLPNDWRWQDVRTSLSPKEIYFEPLAHSRGLLKEPGEGRRTLAKEAAARYGRVRQLCAEDVAALESRVREWLHQRSP